MGLSLWSRRAIPAVVCILALAIHPCMVFAQDGPAKAKSAASDEEILSSASAVASASGELTVAPLTGDAGEENDSSALPVRLRTDGNLSGRTIVLEVDGKRIPVRAEVSFFEEGNLAAKVWSNELGHFQVVGLEPGVYSVVAQAKGYFGNCSVTVLETPGASDLTVPAEEMTLELILKAAEDTTDGDGDGIVAGFETAPASGGGGGGGGGAAFGALAGLAALAGLGGGGAGGQGAATPFTLP